jgi:electron transfer flavoprotein beta subunit
MPDMVRAARATIRTWSAADAGIADVTMCGLRGSPTVVKKVFAPKARAQKAVAVEGDTPQALVLAAIEQIFSAQPKLEQELLKSA